MYHLYCFFTQNSMKTLYVAEELGCDYEFHFVNLMTGENRSEEFRKLTPVGKVPVMEHNGFSLFESGAICRYMASSEHSALYPADPEKRAQVDQWMDYFVCHPGRWLMSAYFQKIIKPAAGMGAPDPAAIEEAEKFVHQGLKVVDRVLGDTPWLANGELSIADLTALAYIEQEKSIDFPLDDYPKVRDWYSRLEALESVARVRAAMAPHIAAVKAQAA